MKIVESNQYFYYRENVLGFIGGVIIAIIAFITTEMYNEILPLREGSSSHMILLSLTIANMIWKLWDFKDSFEWSIRKFTKTSSPALEDHKSSV